MAMRPQLFENFHKISRSERLMRLKDFCDLNEEDLALLGGEKVLSCDMAEHMIENVIGYFQMPLGVASHFVIDGREIFIPMAVEETSIIAAASATAKWIKKEGSITTSTKGNWIIGQIQLPNVSDVAKTRNIFSEKKSEMIGIANASVSSLVKRGGGIQEIVIREIARPNGDGVMMVIHLMCNPCDAMGANLINQVCELLKPKIEEWTHEKVGLCILSNLVDSKLAIAEVVIRNIEPTLGKGIEEATLFAMLDPYRAATHNKGVLNGIDPILIATGNDWRAAEAGIHAFAARSGSYRPVTQWEMVGNDLHGKIEIPLAVGTAGGVTKIHPISKTALKILGINHAEELARICAAVGLVQNLGALKALTTVGIVRGHMQLHAANLAIAAGAEIHEIPRVRDKLTEVLRVEKNINLTRAKEILEAIRGYQRPVEL
jgi:hydroxymethylglutaryl-CoA reductase